MANIIRSAKSGCDWTINELDAYNIHIVNKTEYEFFGENVSSYQWNIPGDINDPNSKVSKYINFVLDADSEESSVDDLARELLSVHRYDEGDKVIRMHKRTPLLMCGCNTIAEADVFIMNSNRIFLLVQEDKSGKLLNPDPEPQMVAEAIAAFQYNNNVRERNLGQQPINECLIPCITMVGLRPVFYKVSITQQLNIAVRTGSYPEFRTVIDRFNPAVMNANMAHGFLEKDNRSYLSQCFLAFKKYIN